MTDREFPEPFTPADRVSPKVSAKIRNTADIVRSMVDPAEAQDYVNRLNGELAEEGLIGQSVVIDSAEFMWTLTHMEPDGSVLHEPVLDPAILLGRRGEGILTAIELFGDFGERQLAYRAEAILDTPRYDTLSFSAPINTSILTLKDTAEAVMTRDDALKQEIAKLQEVTFSDQYDEDLMGFIETIDALESIEALSAPVLYELGVQATWLMSYDVIKHDPEKRQALTETLALLLHSERVYELVGEELTVYDASNGEAPIPANGVDIIEYQGTIRGIGWVVDYEGTFGEPLTMVSDGEQPAIIVDVEGITHSIPLKRLTRFRMVQQGREVTVRPFSHGGDDCRRVLQGFRLSYFNALEETERP